MTSRTVPAFQPGAHKPASGRRLAWATWTTSCTHLLLLFFAIESESWAVRGVCLLLIAAVSLFAWSGNFRRWRAIIDTPTSRIESAAQGYVELQGMAAWQHPQPLMSELRGTHCCWYWFRIERKTSKDEWTIEQEGESPEPFVLDDGSGKCILHPAEAEIQSSRRETWREDDRRYTERLILPGDPLYAIGEFSTLQPLGGKAAVDAEIGALLVRWKQDPITLRERFDLDRDGVIDLKEWALARNQARREVERKRANAPAAPAVNMMRRPADNRLFLLSNMDPESLARKYILWKWLHLALFFTGLGAGTWCLVR
jgi:hypothetical protein